METKAFFNLVEDERADHEDHEGADNEESMARPDHDEDPKRVLFDRLPLDLLCSACFGSDPPPEFVVLCFDACMQQRLLDRSLFNQSDIIWDGRYFINPGIYTPDDEDEVRPPIWCFVDD
jgi:hypothetical protein